MAIHGSGWKSDDHIGKLPSRDGKSCYDSPSRMEADVHVLKTALMNSGLVGKCRHLPGRSSGDEMAWSQSDPAHGDAAPGTGCSGESGAVCWILELSPRIDGRSVPQRRLWKPRRDLEGVCKVFLVKVC